MDLAAIDIGGTHARFALTHIGADGAIELAAPVTLKTGDYEGLHEAWEAFCKLANCDVPSAAAIAIAGPVTGGSVRMTNNSWVLETGAIDAQLGVDRAVVLNDFGAVAHGVAQAGAQHFQHKMGDDVPLPQTGTISVVGPGTGLGVAQVHRVDGTYHVAPTEGGHVGFVPEDEVDDAILARLRKQFGRVSVERVVSGPGIVPIYQTLCELDGVPAQLDGDRAIWQAALEGSDPMAQAAMERFCLLLGGVAGDFALAHGAAAVVLAGGLGYRLRHILPKSGFATRFCGKGRYEPLMRALPVKLVTMPEPGLYGAAAAFLQKFGDA